MVMTSQFIPQVSQWRLRGDEVKESPPHSVQEDPLRERLPLPCAIILAFNPTTHPGGGRNR